MSEQAFKVVRSDRSATPVDIGATVYPCKGWDYGCSSEDSRHLGIEFVSVTLEADGGYPFFTIPKEDLVALTPQEAD